MHAHILGVVQELSFVEGDTVNYMVVQLPNGQKVRALIDSSDAVTLTTLFVKTGGAAAQRALDEIPDVETPTMSQPTQQSTKAHPALGNLGSNGSERAAAGKSYTPLTLDDDGEGTFGGDFTPGMDDELNDNSLVDQEQMPSELAAVDRELQAAAASISSALGMDPSTMDAAALRRAVASLQLDKVAAPAALPQPSWESSIVQPTTTRIATRDRQVLTLQADAKGNPIFHGANTVAIEDLTGGNTDGEEPGEVGSI